MRWMISFMALEPAANVWSASSRDARRRGDRIGPRLGSPAWLVDRFLIRRPQFLHERHELVEVLQHQRDVFLELNGFYDLERRLELRQALFLFRLRDGFVGLERRDLILDQFGRLGELLGLRIDAGHDHCDIRRHVLILGEARKAVLFGDNRGLRVYLRIRFVRIRAIIEIRNVIKRGHEALNVLLSELDLLHLLRNGRAGIKKSENQKCGEQYTKKPLTHAHRVSVSNERHGMVLHLDIASPHNFGRGMTAASRTWMLTYFSVTSGNSINSHLFASVIHASRMRAKYSRS